MGKCSICGKETGIGHNFGAHFMCLGCMEWLVDFLRETKLNSKKKK